MTDVHPGTTLDAAGTGQAVVHTGGQAPVNGMLVDRTYAGHKVSGLYPPLPQYASPAFLHRQEMFKQSDPAHRAQYLSRFYQRWNRATPEQRISFYRQAFPGPGFQSGH